MQTKTAPTSDAHTAVYFTEDEWGALSEPERGQVLNASREAAGTGAKAARRLRRRARHKLNQGIKALTTSGPIVVAWPSKGARGEVWVPKAT